MMGHSTDAVMMEKTEGIIFVRKHLLDIVTKPMVRLYQQSFII